MTGNFLLRLKIDQAGFTQSELVDALNAELRAAGERDSVGDRTVRTWLTGESAWPHRAKRAALTAVFGCTVQELGFVDPAAPAPPQEDPDVIRRTFLNVSAGVVAAPLIGSRPFRVGTSDVARLRTGLQKLTDLDDRRGGHAELEKSALAGAREAVTLQNQAASQRVRLRLFSVAADFVATAAWSCIDARQLERAHGHLNEALRLAGMGQDPAAQLRVWNSSAMLAHQRGEHGEAVAAGQAAQSVGVTRSDPLFASLAHARTGCGHANRGDRQAALRSIGYAEEALTKAHDRPRPPWVSFYGPAELHALSAVVRDRIGEHAAAEAASYRALAVLPAHFRRNRALITCRLALAQLHQGDADQACATSEEVFAFMSGAPIPARMRVLLGDFYRELLTLAPTATMAREWGDRYRTEWSPT
ncbi:XRE family transcriptional regulator [Streptomyces sp. SYP-A7185]|uniref:XRE family transcriptional regulator n=1 Tax=Streptomyces sp. SYP-A7185 TaxID=3040076 RepID=UPI0038F6952C